MSAVIPPFWIISLLIINQIISTQRRTVIKKKVLFPKVGFVSFLLAASFTCLTPLSLHPFPLSLSSPSGWSHLAVPWRGGLVRQNYSSVWVAWPPTPSFLSTPLPIPLSSSPPLSLCLSETCSESHSGVPSMNSSSLWFLLPCVPMTKARYSEGRFTPACPPVPSCRARGHGRHSGIRQLSRPGDTKPRRVVISFMTLIEWIHICCIFVAFLAHMCAPVYRQDRVSFVMRTFFFLLHIMSFSILKLLHK